jgi:hypothetical protein
MVSKNWLDFEGNDEDRIKMLTLRLWRESKQEIVRGKVTLLTVLRTSQTPIKKRIEQFSSFVIIDTVSPSMAKDLAFG